MGTVLFWMTLRVVQLVEVPYCWYLRWRFAAELATYPAAYAKLLKGKRTPLGK